MTKKEALHLFGGNTQRLCTALDIVRKTWYNWPDPLPQDKIDRINGALIRIAEKHDQNVVVVLGR